MKCIEVGYWILISSKISLILLFAFISTGGAVTSETPGSCLDRPAHNLVLALQQEGHHRSAAVEWRRLALQADDPQEQAGYYWAAAYQYLQTNDPVISEKMLDEAEDAWWDIEDVALPLRAEAAEKQTDFNSAAFYWSNMKRADHSPEATRLAHRKLAALAIRQENIPQARQLLEQSPEKEQQALLALDEFEEGRDKNPRLGGLLGMIPGMGYAYAGEYGNAIRSIILNSIFIYGMVDTANKDQWGAFAVITFFELTWYSGSIYGGIDASHRYNQHRRDQLLREVSGDAEFSPDWHAIPQVTLQFTF